MNLWSLRYNPKKNRQRHSANTIEPQQSTSRSQYSNQYPLYTVKRTMKSEWPVLALLLFVQLWVMRWPAACFCVERMYIVVHLLHRGYRTERAHPVSLSSLSIHSRISHRCTWTAICANGQKVFSFWPNVANFLEMSPSVRKTLKFISSAVISSLRPNIKKVTSQNHGKKNVFSPKSKIGG